MPTGGGTVNRTPADNNDTRTDPRETVRLAIAKLNGLPGTYTLDMSEDRAGNKLRVIEQLWKDARDVAESLEPVLAELAAPSRPPAADTLAPVSGEEHERAMLDVIKERDEAIEWADKLAAALAPAAVVGEHSSANDPWRNALDYANRRSPVADNSKA